MKLLKSILTNYKRIHPRLSVIVAILAISGATVTITTLGVGSTKTSVSSASSCPSAVYGKPYPGKPPLPCSFHLPPPPPPAHIPCSTSTLKFITIGRGIGYETIAPNNPNSVPAFEDSVVLRNISNQSCYLTGPPPMSVVSNTGKVESVDILSSTTGMVDNQNRLNLPPGQYLWFLLEGPVACTGNTGITTTTATAGNTGITTTTATAGNTGITTTTATAGNTRITTTTATAGNTGITTTTATAGNTGITTTIIAKNKMEFIAITKQLKREDKRFQIILPKGNTSTVPTHVSGAYATSIIFSLPGGTLTVHSSELPSIGLNCSQPPLELLSIEMLGSDGNKYLGIGIPSPNMIGNSGTSNSGTIKVYLNSGDIGSSGTTQKVP